MPFPSPGDLPNPGTEPRAPTLWTDTQLYHLSHKGSLNNTLEGINSRITEAEEWINDLEDRKVEITAAEQKIENRLKRNEDSPRDLWNNIIHTNIHIIWGLGRRKKTESEKIFEEIIAENFPNMG